MVAAYVLQPADVPLDVHPYRSQRIEVSVGAPAQEDPQVGLGVHPGLAAVAAQVCGDRRAQHEMIGTYDASSASREGSHTSPCVTGEDER
jgi:hypothetical protein